MSDQPWAWSKGKKFAQSTKSTVHQGSTQRLIPPRCEKNRCCWTAERVFYRFVDLSLDTVHAMSIPRYQSDHPPSFPPLLRNYHWLLQLPRQTRPGSFRFFQLFPPSYPARYFSLVSVLACGNFSPISLWLRIRGVYSLEIVRGRGCWELNRSCPIIF